MVAWLRGGGGEEFLHPDIEEKNQQTMHFCCRKANSSSFAPKTLINGIFVQLVQPWLEETVSG